MNGFEKRAQQIKEKIMEAARDMLRNAKELKQIRIADIAKQADVSQVTIYNYFGNKEGLLREVFKAYADKLLNEFEVYMQGSHPLKEKIEYILVMEKGSFSDLPPGLLKELVTQDRELAEYVGKLYREKKVPWTVRIIEEGQASGEISPDVSIETVLAFMQLYMNQYETMLAMAAQSKNTEQFLSSLVHLFFYGICGKP